MQRSDYLFVTGVVAEFNPFHKGHEYLLKKAGEKGPVVCVLSGNFVQRGETAIAEKRIRAKAALISGADLVLELPVLWSMSTAQNFSMGAVSVLGFSGCDRIMFGSESGDVGVLKKASEILSSPEFEEYLEEKLKSGVTFASARQYAAEKCGLPAGVLEGANNNLGIEYITAAKRLGMDISFDTVKRLGADHDSKEEAEFVSASLIREKLLMGDRAFAEKYMPSGIAELFDADAISDMARIERAVLAVLRTKSIDELKKLPDLSEGIENKLLSEIRLAESLGELYNGIKVKRYTLARIRRLVLSAFIGMDNSFFMKSVPYIRVLGMNEKGKELLKTRVSGSPVPVITRTADINRLDNSARKVFETECRATDLFGLSLKKPLECGLEYTSKIITER